MDSNLQRRMHLLLAPGRVEASTDDKSALGLQVRIGPYELRDSVPLIGMHGLVSHPLPGADVLVAHQGGNRSNPVVLGVNDQVRRLRGSKPGDVGLAHHLGATVRLVGDMIVVEGAGKPVLVRGASKVRIEGDLEVTGEITARVDGAAVRLSTHTHGDAQGGSVGRPTG